MKAMYASLAHELNEMEKLAEELGAKPANTSESRQKKLTAEFRALMGEIEKTKTGAILLTIGPMADPAKATAGLKEADAKRVKRLLVIRERFDLLVPQGQKALDRWEKAKLEFRIKEPNYKSGAIAGSEWEQAKLELKQAERALQTEESALAVLLADLEKVAKELAVSGVSKDESADADFKKAMAEYDALVLRLAKSRIGRVLALIEPKSSWSRTDLGATGVRSADLSITVQLLQLREKILKQVELADKARLDAIDYRKQQEIAQMELDAKRARELDDMAHRADQNRMVHIAAIRSLVDELKKIADDLDPSGKNSAVPSKD